MDIAKLKNRVRRGDLSPIEALNVVHQARLSGRPVSDRVQRWVDKRIEDARDRYGSHGHMFARTLEKRR